jgi:hypothetical protein
MTRGVGVGLGWEGKWGMVNGRIARARTKDEFLGRGEHVQ